MDQSPAPQPSSLAGAWTSNHNWEWCVLRFVVPMASKIDAKVSPGRNTETPSLILLFILQSSFLECLKSPQTEKEPLRLSRVLLPKESSASSKEVEPSQLTIQEALEFAGLKHGRLDQGGVSGSAKNPSSAPFEARRTPSVNWIHISNFLAGVRATSASVLERGGSPV